MARNWPGNEKKAGLEKQGRTRHWESCSSLQITHIGNMESQEGSVGIHEQRVSLHSSMGSSTALRSIQYEKQKQMVQWIFGTMKGILIIITLLSSFVLLFVSC